MNSNVSSVAKRYSSALVECLSGQEIREVREQAEALNKVLEPEVEAFFSKAAVDRYFKKQLLEELISALRVGDHFARALRLLWENNRLAALRAFLNQLLSSLDEALGIRRIEYICASSLSQKELGDIEKELESVLKKAVQLTITVKPEILAGCIVKIGHQVVDMSLTTRIMNIREALSQGV